MNFKELGEFSKLLQVKQYERIYSARNLPSKTCKEIMILGKSNVGKSTLINTLLNHKINKTSKKPGCTKWIGYIRLPNLVLIDIPGYGYSAVSKSKQTFWGEMIGGYINSKRADFAFVLVDARRGIQEIDTQVANSLACPTEFLYTKSDEKQSFIPKEAMSISCRNGIGIIELRKIICEL